MKKFLFVLALLLTGCQSVPVVPKWPEVPEDLLKPCPELETVDPANDKLSVILDNVTDNYKKYYDCRSDKNDWIEWYQGQQKIWKTLK